MQCGGKLAKKRIFGSMLNAFIDFILKNKLVSKDQKLLLAVSGGLDSMVMLHLFYKAGYHAEIAHCNFQLRGADADADEAFVTQAAQQYGFVVHTKRFETKNYATEKQLSTQMAARELRYQWFNELIESQRFNKLATAHHLNDNLETVLLNFIRGTGIDGLCGIPLCSGYMIRPLLFADRNAIKDYAISNKIQWREDQSNKDDHYQRNFLRHNVVPLLEQINPGLLHTFSNNLEKFLASKFLIDNELSKIKSKSQKEAGSVRISKSHFDKTETGTLLLWEMLKEYGFNWNQTKDIIAAMNHTGAMFYADNHILNVDREYLILKPSSLKVEDILIHEGAGTFQRVGEQLHIEALEYQHDLKAKSHEAFIDAAKLAYPLRWRNWREGDKFVPFGMKGHKKISDFLIDEKVPLSEKEEVSILEDARGNIIWLVGFRVDDRFKVTNQTSRILRLQLSRAN